MPRRLTIDTAAGDRWLIGINQKATADWLRTTNHPQGQDPAIALDWANAMGPARPPRPPRHRARLGECHGPRASAKSLERHRELAGAHRRQEPVRTARAAAGSGEVHRR